MVSAGQFELDPRGKLRFFDEEVELTEREAEILSILIAHSVVYEPLRKNVTGYKVSPLGRHDFYGVDLQ